MTLISDTITNHFYEILGSWSNPVILILFIAAIILFLIYSFNKYLVKPIELKHKQEKQEIELKSTRMMALFAELDPDPVIRVDIDGKVNFCNDAATKFFGIKFFDSIFNYIGNISPQRLGEIIENSSNISLPLEFNGIHFNILLKGDSSLGIAQFYLRDISHLRNLEIKLKQLSNYLQNQLDDERFRIANELHDGIIQELYLIQMGIRKLSDGYDKELLQTIRLQIESTTEELRNIIYDLKPKILDELGLEPALRTLCGNVIKETSIEGSIDIIGFESRLDKKLEIYFYRVVQEALSNIAKHSGATEFGVILVKENSLLRLMVTDNGSGLKSDKADNEKTGFGLINMKERTEGLGGIFKINSTDNEGLTIIAEIPLKQ